MTYGTVNADVITTSTAGGVLGAGNASIMKNRIINGGMVIDQRNAGASVTPANGAYTLDRWIYQASQASKVSIQQNAGSVTPPVGFSNYLGVTSLSAYTVGSSETFVVSQRIEGFNTADLGWGTASAKTVTLSFQVYSSLTGTFSGVFGNADATRSYPFTYSVPVANTWTTISVTVAGDTSGTWLTTNGVGIVVYFSLGTGATLSGTAGSWSSNGYYGATGATSVVGTNGATFYITGVQLEVGSSATGFEYRQYTTELQLCQRYFWNIKKSNYNGVCNLAGFNSSDCYGVVSFPVYMRTGPTGAYSSLSAFRVAINGSQPTPSAITFQDMNVNNCVLNIAASVTAGAGGWLSFIASASSTDYISWSAEL